MTQRELVCQRIVWTNNPKPRIVVWIETVWKKKAIPRRHAVLGFHAGWTEETSEYRSRKSDAELQRRRRAAGSVPGLLGWTGCTRSSRHPVVTSAAEAAVDDDDALEQAPHDWAIGTPRVTEVRRSDTPPSHRAATSPAAGLGRRERRYATAEMRARRSRVRTVDHRCPSVHSESRCRWSSVARPPADSGLPSDVFRANSASDLNPADTLTGCWPSGRRRTRCTSLSLRVVSDLLKLTCLTQHRTQPGKELQASSKQIARAIVAVRIRTAINYGDSQLRLFLATDSITDAIEFVLLTCIGSPKWGRTRSLATFYIAFFYTLLANSTQNLSGFYNLEIYYRYMKGLTAAGFCAIFCCRYNRPAETVKLRPTSSLNICFPRSLKIVHGCKLHTHNYFNCCLFWINDA